MYICVCNPFSDRDVKKYLSGIQGKVTVGQVYRGCSGADAPSCCSCLHDLRDMVRDHNADATVRAIGDTMASERGSEASETTSGKTI
jgi:bacterioferritin-associated ferredoxin